MKIATIFGTRPEIIRLSEVMRQLDEHCDQLLVHTGQNYDKRLSDIFFADLNVRAPDVHLGIQAGSFGELTGKIIQHSADVFAQHKPDRILILGDTNSGLAAYAAARMGIPVYHMEAGNRCYDDRVPEEINRRVIDHCSNVLMPYTQRSAENLVREGIPRERIYVTGNPIAQVLSIHEERIDASSALADNDVAAQQFFLVTVHRAENVDTPERLNSLLQGLANVADEFQYPMLVSVHPRTADKLERFGLSPTSSRVKLLPPLGFFDFVKLEKQAFCVLSDSGTVQEECCLFGTPNVTLRDVTERPETIECGSNALAGADADTILRQVKIVTSEAAHWEPPAEYTAKNVAEVVRRIVLGFRLAELR